MKTLLDVLDVTGRVLYLSLLLGVILVTLLYGHLPAVVHLSPVPIHR